MYSEQEIEGAVAAGVLSEDTAKAFRAYVAQVRRAPAADEEYVRFLTGFNDVFVVIACALLLGAVYWMGHALYPSVGGLAMSAMAWVLAEFFTRRRHMALPSIALLLAFVGGVLLCTVGLWASAVGSGVLGALAAWLHWRRFKVPITVAVGVATLVFLAMALLQQLDMPTALGPWLLMGAGIGVFLLAMRWDRSDVQRKTRRSDVAFWLHLLAAPLVVHPVFSMLSLSGDEVGMAQTAGVIALYAAISIVSLATDRRALMVSAVTYVLYAFSALLQDFGSVGMAFSVTAFALGATLLLLSAFWQPCRARVLRRLPAALQRQLPPLQ